MAGGKQRYEYVIYKGDDIICHGTQSECAEQLGVSEQTIMFMSSQTLKNKDKGTRLIAEKVSIAEIEKELELA